MNGVNPGCLLFYSTLGLFLQLFLPVQVGVSYLIEKRFVSFKCRICLHFVDQWMYLFSGNFWRSQGIFFNCFGRHYLYIYFYIFSKIYISKHHSRALWRVSGYARPPPLPPRLRPPRTWCPPPAPPPPAGWQNSPLRKGSFSGRRRGSASLSRIRYVFFIFFLYHIIFFLYNYIIFFFHLKR